jgi:NhaP-type Na+/H+ or K+/H+ antiporter
MPNDPRYAAEIEERLGRAVLIGLIAIAIVVVLLGRTLPVYINSADCCPCGVGP